MLTPTEHDRTSAGLTYVYPVVSRRARGLSLGINLNINNACNWRCIYCQVPNLKRGGPPSLDLDQLEAELRSMLDAILNGDFLVREVPEGMRVLRDIALSGNGEPTSADEFGAVIERIGAVLGEVGLLGQLKLVLITNGSLTHKAAVQSGLRRLAELGGEVWFKIDRASATGILAINDTHTEPARVRRNLATCCGACPTWIQTCMFALDGAPPPEGEIAAYLELLAAARDFATPPRGVLLYGLARPSLQPEAPRLTALPATWLEALAVRIRALGYPVQVNA